MGQSPPTSSQKNLGGKSPPPPSSSTHRVIFNHFPECTSWVHLKLFVAQDLCSDRLFAGAQQMQVETPALGETTLLTIQENGFALEPVPITRTHGDSVPDIPQQHPDENIQ